MDDGRLRVETLGPLRAYAADREIALGPPKQRAVFAMLALRDGREVSRDRLVDGIWGEAGVPGFRYVLTAAALRSRSAAGVEGSGQVGA
ncbi:hypothetical protein ABZ901_19965, partial [Actinacidiphila alni]|uniref:AfsR/SARP family transcriptional regulator n=1 Tax=Actinacidiphila alni TaxID=380248 RepID=UPI00347F531F